MKPEVKLGVMNARSVATKLDYVFDHIIDNNLHIVALTVPLNSGCTGGGVGVLINDRVKLVTRLESINKAVSFESIEMIITIVSIYIVVI